MMLFKLSIRNLKKSIHDYMIYFATLILGIAIFYVFNALETQTVMINASANTHDLIRLMNNTLSGVSVFVSFVLGFLIVYASNFLMKRRKKEFGIYMLLGMNKGSISKIIVIETLLIGLISLAGGLILGIVASQGMSIVVANMFEADMTKFEFVISMKAIGKTIIYFIVMYIVVLVLDTIVVGKAKLINLINSAKKSEKNVGKNPIICTLVFLVACILLGTAYYYVTAGANDLVSTADVLIQIAKGIAGTFMLFWSLSGIILYVAKRFKKFYFKGLNNFTIKEFSSRVNTTVFSGSIICLMLFMTICILSATMSLKKSVDDNLAEMVPVDVNFYKNFGDNDEPKDDRKIEDIFEEKKVDEAMFTDVVDICTYVKNDGRLTMKDTAGEAINNKGYTDNFIRVLENYKEELIKVSDYNKVARLYGIKEYTLKDNEYIIVANFSTMIEPRNEGLKNGNILNIGGREYKPKYNECQDGYLVMGSNNSNFGVILVPDNTNLKDFKLRTNYYLANYYEEQHEKTSTLIDSEKFNDKLNSSINKENQIYILSKKEIYDDGIGITAMVIFIGIYLGIIFMISSAAILALKELSEASDNREKYQVLRKIGVDEKQINKSLFSQCLLFFGMPLLIAGIHSVFGIQTVQFILETFGNSGLLFSILTTAGVIVLIYGAYFLITYYCSKKIISEN